MTLAKDRPDLAGHRGWLCPARLSAQSAEREGKIFSATKFGLSRDFMPTRGPNRTSQLFGREYNGKVPIDDVGGAEDGRRSGSQMAHGTNCA